MDIWFNFNYHLGQYKRKSRSYWLLLSNVYIACGNGSSQYIIIPSRGINVLPPLKYPLHHTLKTSVILKRMLLMVLTHQENSLDTSEAFRQFISKHCCIKNLFSLLCFRIHYYYRVASRSWTLISNKCVVYEKTIISGKRNLSLWLYSANEIDRVGESRSNCQLLDLHEDLNVHN